MHGVLNDAATLMHARLLSVPLKHMTLDKRRHDSPLPARAALLFGAFAAHSLGNLGDNDIDSTPNPGHGPAAHHTFVRWVSVWLHLADGKTGANIDAQTGVVQRLEQMLGRSLSADDALREVPSLLLPSPAYVAVELVKCAQERLLRRHACIRNYAQGHKARGPLSARPHASCGGDFRGLVGVLHSHSLLLLLRWRCCVLLWRRAVSNSYS